MPFVSVHESGTCREFQVNNAAMHADPFLGQATTVRYQRSHRQNIARC